MGDFAYVELHITKDDFKKHKAWLEENDLLTEEGDLGNGSMRAPSMRSAAVRELEELASMGAVFHGTAGGAVGAFGPAIFYGARGEYHEWPSGQDGDGYVVLVDDGGNISTDVRLKLKTFHVFHAAVVRAVTESWQPEEEWKPCDQCTSILDCASWKDCQTPVESRTYFKLKEIPPKPVTDEDLAALKKTCPPSG